MASTKIQKTETKNPWIAAVLNLLVWGLGYLYVGKPKRTLFSVGLVITALLSYVAFYSLDAASQMKLGTAELIGSIVISVTFAWDAYQDVKETSKAD